MIAAATFVLCFVLALTPAPYAGKTLPPPPLSPKLKSARTRCVDLMDELGLCLTVGSHASSSCCTRYSRKPVPPQLIRGYREQTAMENCQIEAIM